MDKEYTVYMHTNKINGKKYIGITCQGVERRWRNNGSGYKNSIYFYNAIQKYGWENFNHKVLEEGLTKEYAESEEIRLIKEYKTTDRNNGYNIANGGKSNGMHSEETKKKMSEKVKQRDIDYSKLSKMWEINRNRTYTEEHKQNISKANKGKKRTEEHIENIRKSHLGYKQTEEQKAKISKSVIKALESKEMREKLSIIGKKNVNAIANLKKMAQERIKIDEIIILTNTKEQFKNHIEAGKKYGIQNNKILKNCQNKTHSAGKDKEGNPLIWVFKKSFQDGFDYHLNLQETYSKINSEKTKSKVICITTSEVFEQIKDAANKYGLKSPTGISMVCSGKRSYSGKLPDGTKLEWKYAS